MEAGRLAATPVPEGVTFSPVDAGGVPAEWNDAEGGRQDRVIIYFHGGGYCMGSLSTHRGHTARISLLANLRVLSVDYRLGPEHPHPAAVLDAVAAYRFVLDQGIAPSKIALAGDSAGGGLMVAALLAIRDQDLPLPSCGAGISSWTDLTGSGDSMKTRADEEPADRWQWTPSSSWSTPTSVWTETRRLRSPRRSSPTSRACLPAAPGRHRGGPARRFDPSRRARQSGRRGCNPEGVAGHVPRLACVRRDAARRHGGHTGARRLSEREARIVHGSPAREEHRFVSQVLFSVGA